MFRFKPFRYLRVNYRTLNKLKTLLKVDLKILTVEVCSLFFFVYISQILTCQENIYKSITKFYQSWWTVTIETHSIQLKKSSRFSTKFVFFIFTYMIVVQLNFLTVLCARHIRNAQDEMGGINLTIMKVFIKDFFLSHWIIHLYLSNRSVNQPKIAIQILFCTTKHIK